MSGRDHIVWVPNGEEHFHIFTVLNFCALMTKHHIYCHRIHNENALNYFLAKLKNNLK